MKNDVHELWMKNRLAIGRSNHLIRFYQNKINQGDASSQIIAGLNYCIGCKASEIYIDCNLSKILSQTPYKPA